MKQKILLGLIFLLFAIISSAQTKRYGLVIHGGAGTILKKQMTDQRELEYLNKLEEALRAGYNVLENNGSSLDAVNAAINIMEDSPLFNAGKGAVLTIKGKAELDASIMDGKTLNAGAVAGLTHIKNPINLARAVMEKSEHVMMIGEGAEEFAKENNLEFVDNEYFITPERLNTFQRLLKSEEEKKKAGKKRHCRRGRAG
jgi:L-asparaginase / beta-aspartyl-peptidase